MSENKGIKLAGICIFGLIAVYIATVIFMHEPLEDGIVNMNIYYINPLTNKLVPETRKIKIGTEVEMSKQVLDEFLLGPQTAGLTNGIADNTIFERQQKLVNQPNNNTRFIEIYFTDQYLDIAPAQEILLRSALVWTLTELEWVDSVYFFTSGIPLLRADGNPIQQMNRENVLIDPQITQKKVSIKIVELYFANRELTGLVAERRTIEVPSGGKEEQIIIEELLKGPTTPGLISTIPSETSINDAYKAEGTCYVDVNPAFESKLLPNFAQRELAVYSIVNSLTVASKGEIRKVQFWINAEKLPNKNNSVDLSQPFEQNLDIIIPDAPDDY